MEKRTVHSFNGLAIFVFFLYFANVSSDPINRISIIESMKNDKELCEIPVVLYNNTILSTCANESYPVGHVEEDYKNRNTFLCLVFYDTWNKVCQSSQLIKLFNTNLNNEKAFNDYLQQLAPKNNDNNGTMFCNSIKGLTFSHRKLKPILSFLKDLDYSVCHPFCFNIKKDFIPLCEVLAWSKHIDNDTKKVTTKSETGLGDIKLQNNESQNEDQSLKGQDPIIQAQVTTEKYIDTKTKDEGNKDTPSTGNVKPSNVDDELVQTSEVLWSTTDAQKHGDNNVTRNQQKTNNESADFKNAHKVHDPKKEDKEQQKKGKEQQKEENGLQKGGKEPQTTNEDTQTVNKDTQTTNEDLHNTNKDLQNINKVSEELNANAEINQDDWNHSQTDKITADQNDQGRPDTPIDTVDRSQNMHKPSEEKDNLSSFHTMRTDEESHFFTYFTVLSFIFIVAYIGCYNKQKILAIILEGRRSRNSRGRRRPSTANYRKLDCTLEEAVTSQCNANVTHVIY